MFHLGRHLNRIEWTDNISSGRSRWFIW